jgi:hypothetical protein
MENGGNLHFPFSAFLSRNYKLSGVNNPLKRFIFAVHKKDDYTYFDIRLACKLFNTNK